MKTVMLLVLVCTSFTLSASDIDDELIKEAIESGKHNPSIWKVEELLLRGADPNAKNPKSRVERALLHEAADKHCADIAQVLLAAGAEIDGRDSQGETPLMRTNRNASVIQELIKAGADVDATDRHGETALSKASYHGDAASVQLLLLAGADPNKPKTSNGYTPLIRAVRRERIHVVQMLLENGARIDIKTKRGQTVFDFCKNETILRLLKAAE
jgi:ankyrin repeat protein